MSHIIVPPKYQKLSGASPGTGFAFLTHIRHLFSEMDRNAAAAELTVMSRVCDFRYFAG